MASNARPLWSALPDGALKRQLLGEIAETGAAGRARTDRAVGAVAPSRRRPRGPAGDAPRRRRRRPGGHGMAAPTPTCATTAVRLRGHGPTRAAPQPARRPVRAPSRRRRAPGPCRRAGRPRGAPAAVAHGRLGSPVARTARPAVRTARRARPAVRLARQPVARARRQPWAALREGLRGQPFEALAERLMTDPDGDAGARGRRRAGRRRRARTAQRARLHARRPPQGPAERSRSRRSAADPLALERYRELETRRSNCANA